MDALFIPSYSFWENKNTWYGSVGNARFYIQPTQPQTEEDSAEGHEPAPVLSVELWRGPLTLDMSTVLQTADFPMDEDGLAAMAQWLEEQTTAINQSDSL